MGRKLTATAMLAGLAVPSVLTGTGVSGPTASQARAVAGLYHGGAIGRDVQLFSVRLNGAGTRADQRATLTSRCQGDPAIRRVRDYLRLSQTVVDDGRSRGSGALEGQVPAGVPGTGGLVRRGTVRYRIRFGAGGRAAGIIRSRFRLTDPASGSTRARCDSGTVRWSARIAGSRPGRGKPAPVAGAGYFGPTAQRLPFLLRVVRGGRAVRPAGMAFRAACPSLRGLPVDLAAQARMPIRRGRFGDRGAFTRRYASDRFGPVTERYRWRLAGRFGREGAEGAWRVDGVVTRDSDGAEVATCSTGRNRWRAVR